MRTVPALSLQPEPHMVTSDNVGSTTPHGQHLPDDDVQRGKPTDNKRRQRLSYADAQTLSRLSETLTEEDRAVALSLLRGRRVR